ncbi:unnamed protein product [Rhizophagus irregularis]|nr:unnamed protein product [Rhizophagus irregularis]
MDIRAVVAIDFGTTFSGFAYAYRSSPEIITNDSWPQQIGPLKTNTVLQYDTNYQNVTKWGNPALAQRQSRRNGDSSSSKTVELFKLHLGNIPQNEKPPLPRQLSYDKAISDYLRELAEFDDRAKDTMRKCLYNAGLTNSKESNKVEFTTEPEAAAIYCMRNLEGQNKPISINESFMVVDCGGGTVDLTTRKLLRDNKLSEITERTGAIVRGACDYGLEMSTIIDRTLKYSYGFETYRSWKFGDPINRRKSIKGNNKTKIMIFHCLATRGTTVGIDEEFRTVSCPSMPDQTEISYPIYITTESSAKFCDESGMKLHGTLTIDLPDVHLGLDRQVEFSLIFGKMELVAKAKNLRNGRIYNTSFDLNLNF